MFLLIGFGLLIPCLMMMVMMVLSVLRKHAQTEELLGSLAVGHDRRSIGHACPRLGAASWQSWSRSGSSSPSRSTTRSDVGRRIWPTIAIPRPNIAQILQGPLAVIAMLVFVVALVRWVPSWLVLLPITFLLLVQGLWVGMWHGAPTQGRRWVFPLNSGVVNGKWVGCTPEAAGANSRSPVSTRRLPGGAAYLLALCPLFGSIAVLRHRRAASRGSGSRLRQSWLPGWSSSRSSSPRRTPASD